MGNKSEQGDFEQPNEEPQESKKPRKQLGIILILIIIAGCIGSISAYALHGYFYTDKKIISTCQSENTYYKNNLNITCQIVNLQSGFIQQITNQSIQLVDCEGLIKAGVVNDTK